MWFSYRKVAKIHVFQLLSTTMKTKNTLENLSNNHSKSMPEPFQKLVVKSIIKKSRKNRSKSGKWSPKGAGIGGEKLNISILFRFRVPRWPQDAQDGPKKPPRPPQEPPKTPQRTPRTPFKVPPSQPKINLKTDKTKNCGRSPLQEEDSDVAHAGRIQISLISAVAVVGRRHWYMCVLRNRNCEKGRERERGREEPTGVKLP